MFLTQKKMLISTGKQNTLKMDFKGGKNESCKFSRN